MNNKEVSIRGIPFNKTILCQYLKDEGKCMNQTCKYAHSDEEKNNAIAYYKDQTCTGWLKSKCKFGKKCMLLHGFKNLEAGAKIDCTFIRNIILIRKFPVSFDAFENGNIMMKLNNIDAGFTIVNENGKELLDINPIKNTLYDKFKIYNNNNFICSSDKILMISKLPKIDETNHNIMTKFSGRKKNIAVRKFLSAVFMKFNDPRIYERLIVSVQSKMSFVSPVRKLVDYRIKEIALHFAKRPLLAIPVCRTKRAIRVASVDGLKIYDKGLRGLLSTQEIVYVFFLLLVTGSELQF